MNCVNCNCPFVNNNNNIKKGWGDFFVPHPDSFLGVAFSQMFEEPFFVHHQEGLYCPSKTLSTWRPPEHTDQEISAFHYNRWWVLVSSRYIDWSNPKKSYIILKNTITSYYFYYGANWRSKREIHIICITWNHKCIPKCMYSLFPNTSGLVLYTTITYYKFYFEQDAIIFWRGDFLVKYSSHARWHARSKYLHEKTIFGTLHYKMESWRFIAAIV